MKTKREIIDETVAYYSEDPKRRATFGDTCSYLDERGHKCAVGRCLLDPAGVQRLASACGNGGPINSLFKDTCDLDEVLMPEYRGHSVAFWRSIQVLHDGDENWTPNGLSTDGKIEHAVLVEKWGDQ